MDLLQNTPFPNRELPPNALDAVYDSLQPRGFKRDSMIEQDYAFSVSDGSLVKTNLLAFTHESFRGPDYTGLTVFNPANGETENVIVDVLAQSAAPFHLIHNQQTQRFSFWFSNVPDRTAQSVEIQAIEKNIEYTRLQSVFEDYSVDLNPSRILDVKQGRDIFKRVEYSGLFQLTLWAIEVTGERLVEHFGYAVEALRNSSIPMAAITPMAVQLLGATVLAHTGKLGEEIRQYDPPVDQLISAASKEFPNYFDLHLFTRWLDAATSAYKVLTQLRYSGFSPELLTQLYRETFPDKAQRREMGRYDTPLYLARRIWDTIPVEFLPPEKRVLADLTCGWGSFLIAGYERLSRMTDLQGHQLRDHIYGNDSDEFTARLAGLGLLISTLQDRWRISHQNALLWRLDNPRPNIIVGNPPFRGSRKEPFEESMESSSRYEKANLFLEHAIEILPEGGYLAMLMPQSFVASEASPKLRKKLLETCDVVELWELPIGVFLGATANSLVIFARKTDVRITSSFPIRIRTVQVRNLPAFRDRGPFTASNLVNTQAQWGESSRRSQDSKNTYIMDYSLILPQDSWDRIHANCVPLEQRAIIFTGTIRGNPKRRRWANYRDSKPVRWISGTRNQIQDSFQMTYEDPQLLVYPNDFERPRLDKQAFLDGKKVLLNALANPSWGKRVKVAIERRGYYISHNFIVLVPKDEQNWPYVSHEVLAAVVDWKVSNAWLLEHLKHTQFPMRAIRNIPFPNLTISECEVLTDAVLTMEDALAKGMVRPLSATQTIDRTLRRAYALDDETYERLTLIAEWDTNPQPTLDLQSDPYARWETSGFVDSLNANDGTITFWLSGFDELQTVPIVAVMPGWLLRPGVAFRTSIPRACVRKRSLGNNISWGYFQPQDYTYLSEEQLFTELLEVLG